MAGKQTVARKASADAPKPVRSRFAEDLATHYPDVMALLQEAGKATKRVSVPFACKKCGASQMQWADVPDGAMAIKVAEFLANQGLGRPGEDQSSKSGSGDFVVQRYVVDPEDEDASVSSSEAS